MVAIAVALAICLVLPRSPTFFANVEGGRETYQCANGERLPVEFSQDGHRAKVQYRGRTLDLVFTGDDWFDDAYRAGEWRLYLDPEANFYGPGGLHLIC